MAFISLLIALTASAALSEALAICPTSELIEYAATGRVRQLEDLLDEPRCAGKVNARGHYAVRDLAGVPGDDVSGKETRLTNNTHRLHSPIYAIGSPLYWASVTGQKRVVKMLLTKPGINIDVNLADEKGSTPLIWAAFNGHEKVYGTNALLFFSA